MDVIGTAPARFTRTAPPSADLRARIRAGIAADPARAPHTGRRLRVALALVPCIAALAVASASAMTYGRQAVGLDVQPAGAEQLRLVLGTLAGLTLAATYVALKRRRDGGGVLALLLVAAAVVPAYAALTLVDPLHASQPTPAGVVLSPWGARCLVLAAVVGGVALAAFAAALQRAVAAASVARGAALGAAAGAWAGLAVFVFCPAGEALHLVVGHLLPVAALTLVGALAAPRMLRP